MQIMSHRGRSLVWCAALLASSACALLIDFSGLSGGAPDGSVGMSSSGAVTQRDGGSFGEAGGPLGFCAGHAPVDFCDDFDQPDRTSMAQGRWSSPQNQGLTLTGANLTADQSTSAPRAARMVVEPDTAGLASDQTGLQFPEGTTRVRVTTRIRPHGRDDPQGSADAARANASPVLSLRYGSRSCTLEYHSESA